MDIVTADGSACTASADENPDLFWGVRGGGGNFGVVTSFEFRLHPVGPNVLAGMVAHPIERAGEVLRLYDEWTGSVPDQMASIAAVFTCPPEPPFPAELHGRHVAGVIVNWVGPHAEGERVLAPVRAFGPPAVDTIAPTPFVELQSSQDEKFAWGRRYYNKNLYLDRMDERVLDLCVTHLQRVTSPLSAVALQHMAGAVSRVGAAGDRVPQPGCAVQPGHHLDLDRPRGGRPPRGMGARLPRGGPAVLHGQRVREHHVDGGRARRPGGLRSEPRPTGRVKDRYDPTNLFRLNQNIPPSGDVAS